MTYAEKLLDPRWQKKRLEILNRDNFTCQYCNDKEKTLMVHHTYYEKNKEPWEATNDHLITLCSDCHKYFHESLGRYQSNVIDMMKLKLKDPFITGCASDLFRDIKDLHQLIYLLWELKDDEDELNNILTKVFQKITSDALKNEECHVSEV